MAEQALDDETIGELAVMTYEESETEDLEVTVPAYGSKLAPDGDWLPEKGSYEGPGARVVELFPTANTVVVESIRSKGVPR